MSPSNSIFTCHLCKRRNPITFESIDHLEAHFAQHHFQCLPYVCEQCPQFASGLYPTEGAIIEHMKLVHGTESEFEFKIIIRDDTEEKRAKVRAAVEHCLRSCTVVTTSSSTATTTSINDIAANEQHQPQQQAQTSQQPRVVQFVAAVPTVVVRTEAQQTGEKHSSVNSTNNAIVTPADGGGAASGTAGRNGVMRTSSGGGKRNATDAAVGTAKGAPVWKIPKKNTNKKGNESGGKSKDGHNSQQTDSAAKGGYNGLNIDGLFEEMEQQTQRTMADNGSVKKENGTEVEELENGNNNAESSSINGRDDLVRSPSIAPQSSPIKLQISKGIDGEQSQGFFGSQKSSTLGLVLYKAEKEGRDLRSRSLRSGQSPQSVSNTQTVNSTSISV